MSKWYIPDMYWPARSSGRDYVSHEAVCVLNPSGQPCKIRITLFFEDRDPAELETVVCSARRTVHIRMDAAKCTDGSAIPRGVGYAAIVDCDSGEAVVQYTRVDTTQPELALMTAMAHRM